MPGHHHRSGSLRQSNKKNKRNKASKRSFSRLNGGKVQDGHGRVGFKQALVAHSKNDRRHIQQQRREAKRLEVLRRRRGIDGGPSPARIVGIVSLAEDERDLEEAVRSLILSQADRVIKTFGITANGKEADSSNDDGQATIHTKHEAHKKDGNLTILTNSTSFRSHYSTHGHTADDSSVLSALDMCRVCDIILFAVDGNGARPDDNVLGMSIGTSEDPSVSTKRSNATSVQDWDHLISQRGDKVLTAVKGQGLPRVITLLAKTRHDPDAFAEDHMTTQSAKSIRRSNIKRKVDLKKYIGRFATTEFGVNNEKVIEVDITPKASAEDFAMDDNDDNSSEGGMAKAADSMVDVAEHTKRTLAASFVRTLCTISASPTKWVSQLPRAHILSDRHTYDAATQEFQITGYVRGLVPFDVNALMHVPNLGTFQCKSLKRSKHPYYRNKNTNKNKGGSTGSGNASMDADFDEHAIHPDPDIQESLQMFATPDALEGEQNLIGFDDADGQHDQNGEGKDEQEDNFARPAGWSDYQSAWLGAVDDDSLNNDDMDYGELARQLNQKPSSASVAPADAMELEDANQISEEERKALLEQRRKEEQEHAEFPDEVQVLEGENASERFARYRALKSFRKSQWDPKENLPDTYASIYHFANFKATQRSVMLEMKDLMRASQSCGGSFWNGVIKSADDQSKNGKVDADAAMISEDEEDDDDILEGCVPSGSYITVTLANVSQDAFNGVCPDSLLSLVTLLPHENKVSVLHMGLSKTPSDTLDVDPPIKSKDTLIFRCGWRTWEGRPVFSQHNLNSDKHKMERFMPPPGGFFAASVFGPVTYTPSPILVFRQRKIEGEPSSLEMVAIGSMLGSDADRIIIKRIVLTGYPTRVHKRHATVKYMFYNPDDVKWFKPAGLVTKHGLQGNIEQSVGEHGTMKCLFNAPIKQHDTVCLPLYKRIFPKFVPVIKEEAAAGDESKTVRSIRNRDVLIVK